MTDFRVTTSIVSLPVLVVCFHGKQIDFDYLWEALNNLSETHDRNRLIKRYLAHDVAEWLIEAGVIQADDEHAAFWKTDTFDAFKESVKHVVTDSFKLEYYEGDYFQAAPSTASEDAPRT